MESLAFDYGATAALNMFLFAAAVFALIYYVVISNSITAARYQIGNLGNELVAATEENAVLTEKKLSLENSSDILEFAESRQMAKATRVTHLFENGNVALQR